MRATLSFSLQSPNRFQFLVSDFLKSPNFSSSSHPPPFPFRLATMKMKRQRKSKPMHSQQESTEEDGARASITDLPIQILMDIQSRLSVKSIFRCRSVCKLWLDVLLTPDFAKLHFSRAPTCPLLHNPDGKLISTALYLVEIERDRLCYVCDDENRRSTKLCENNCSYHGSDGHVNMKLSTRFTLTNLESSSDVKSKDRFFNVVNSCNGLLCLRGSLCEDPVLIYNPVTGEYSALPTPGEDEFTKGMAVGGLGFCPKTNQFKVLVILRTGGSVDCSVAFVFALGSRTWRRIGSAPRSLCLTSFNYPIFLNGALHWYIGDDQQNNLIVCFDFKEEKFQIMPFPRLYCPRLELNKLDKVSEYIDEHCTIFSLSRLRFSVGVLRGRLFICDTSYCDVSLWVMKDYGVQDSWFEELEIKNYAEQNLPMGLYQPIDFLNNGNLLMYQEYNALISYDRHESRDFKNQGFRSKYLAIPHDSRYFKIRGFRSTFQAIHHVPSFLSLKEVMGGDMEVLNVKSRLANSQLREGNTKPLPLVEEEHSFCTSDCDSCSSSEESSD